MNDKEEYAFKAAYQFYAKWRETVLETDEQWLKFAEDVQKTGAELDGNLLAERLLIACIEQISFLYKNGMKPLPADYFGRDDIGH